MRALAGGEVVRQRMEAGATHEYVLALGAGEFAQVVVEQRGVNVGVKVSGPGAALLVDMDSPNGSYGRETVSVVAEEAGSYKVELYLGETFPPGDYELRVEGPRAATAADAARVKAERVYAEAQALRGAGKYDEAEAKYEEALGLWRDLGEPRGQGYSLTYTGRIHRQRGQLAPALESLGEALALLTAAGDLSGQAFVLNERGAAQRLLGDLRGALADYERALGLRLGLGDRWGQAQLYNNIGLTYSLIGYQPQAGENYERALPLWRELGMRGEEMRTLVNAAKAHAEMGDLHAAQARYQEVLTFCEAEGAGEASPLKPLADSLKPSALNGLGLVHDTWADSDAALDNYGRALDLFRANKDRGGEADVLDNLGWAHAFLGDARQALEYFKQALPIREALNGPKGRAATLSNIGHAHALLGEHEAALKHLKEALDLSRGAGDRRFEAYTLVWTGMTHVARDRPCDAVASYEGALAIQQEKGFADRRGQAITLDKLGEAHALCGQTAEALGRYGQALELWKAVGDEQGLALTLHGLARVESGRQNLANARDRAEEAVAVVERLRVRVSRRQLQMTYFAAKQDLYALAADVRMRLHGLTGSQEDVAAALSLNERARARTLVDLLTEAGAGLPGGASPQDADRSRRLEEEIGALTQTLLRMRGLENGAGAALIRQKLSARTREQEELQAAAKRAGARSAGAIAGRPLSAREIQLLLDDDTVLLQYALGERQSHLWAVTRAGIEHHPLAGRAEVERAAAQLRRALTAYEPPRPGQSDLQYLERRRAAPEQYRQGALELGRLLLGPVAAGLGGRRVVIVADGVLQYVPFEALLVPADPAAGRTSPPHAPLLMRNEVVYQPSASTLALLRGARRRANPHKLVAVLADPVFDGNDSRVRAGGGRAVAALTSAPPKGLARSLRDVGEAGGEDLALTRLDYSLQEANSITSAAPRGSWMKAVGFRASRATATSPALRQFSIVHFATHGLLNEKHPELSGIVLSLVDERGRPSDGFLSLRDIYRLELPADLVVLSACRTGIGKQVRGEGMIGLTRGFMYAGAPRVVVSLWRVEDEATAELMKRFYRHMLGKNRMPAAAALRRAKIEMAEGGGPWGAPYYWAGFVLQGDWK